MELDSTGGLFTPFGSAPAEDGLGTGQDVGKGFPDSASDTRPRLQSGRELRSRQVRVDVARLAVARDEVIESGSSRLRLNLLDDVDFDVEVERTAPTRHGYSLSGRIAGYPHSGVTMVVSDGIVAASVQSREGAFVVTSRNGAIHTVREVVGDFRCGVGERQEGTTELPLRRKPISARTHTMSATDADDGAEIDALVLFTEAALRVEGGLRQMRASIDLAVAYTNDAYHASGVETSLNLVAAVQVDYRESDLHGGAGIFNQREDMKRLIDPSDGFMDYAHGLRDNYAADIVHLIVDQSAGGGISSVLSGTAEDPAASAVSVSNSLSDYPRFLAHEAGHVMGLRHDRYVDPRTTLHPYSHGYVNQRAFDLGASKDRRWYTIMAYSAQCRDAGFESTCRELPRFSNPQQRYPDSAGDPLGVPGDEPTEAVDGPADAVRSLNETRELIAGFRRSAERCEYAVSDRRREVPASGGDFEIEIDTACSWTATAFGDFLEVESEATGKGGTAVTYRVGANDGPARVGYVVVAGETLSVFQSGAVAPASVCDRSASVRDALVEATGRECGEISEFDLLEVSVLDLAHKEITELDESDFTGLRYLVELDLSRNGLAAIPEHAFRDLFDLKFLRLSKNRLATVPRAVSGLPSLQELDVSDNVIADLRSDAFDGLSKLRQLLLGGNNLTNLSDDGFSDLKELRYLNLSDNGITDVRKQALRGLEYLISVYLNGNPLGTLREDAFANVRNVSQVFLGNTQLSTVPPKTFAEMTRLGWLGLGNNNITDLSDVVFPGNAIGWLDLSNNELRALPAGIFEDFTSPVCGARNLDLDLSGNPGAPFPLRFELERVDAGPAAPGPAMVVARVREGASWPIDVRVVGEVDASFTRNLTVVNGDIESERFEVAEGEAKVLRFAAAPTVPGSYKGIRIALGAPLQLFSLADQEAAPGAEPLTIDLDQAMGRDGVSYVYRAESGDSGVVTVRIDGGMLILDPVAEGTSLISVTATDGAGATTTRTFAFTVKPELAAEGPRTWRKVLMQEALRRRSEQSQ